LVQVGQVIGPLPTIALLLAMSLLGAYLLRREGSRTFRAFRSALGSGRVPAKEVADGALVIFGLRQEAEAALGDAFDIRAFHERVLENGALPLWQLQNHVRAWIAASQAE
ncbi:MAG: DUF885 domain-containing protein, partial [Proteobacteria bacterium]|nr:DUF885 domain-containing protein [Pseudomonadota bacterium]